MPAYPVDTYQIRIYSSRSSTDLNAARGDVMIFLCHQGTYRGVIRFYPDGTVLPPGSHDSANGQVTIHLNVSQFESVVDVLRNEEPVYVYGSTNWNFLLTSLEPVGEEEGRGGP